MSDVNDKSFIAMEILLLEVSMSFGMRESRFATLEATNMALWTKHTSLIDKMKICS